VTPRAVQLLERSRPAPRHGFCSGPAGVKLDDRRQRIGSPFDESRLLLVREFLRREFRDCYHRDFFAFDLTAQVFLIETGRGYRHTLVVPRTTLDHPDLAALCNPRLVASLTVARDRRVTLTPEGPDDRSEPGA
jgi:hypothetical protein